MRYLLLLSFIIINNYLYSQQMTGWFDSVVSPTTGDTSTFVISAVDSNSAYDNVRLHHLAVYDPYSNCTFGAHLGGDSAENAGIYVFGFNHTTQEQIDRRGIYIFSEQAVGTRYDGHTYPTIVRTHDGHIHVLFCDQRGDALNVHIRFTERGSITSDYVTRYFYYGGDGIMGKSGSELVGAEYPKPFVSRNGAMYFASRTAYSPEPYYHYDGESYRIALRGQILFKSRTHGLTWDPAKVAIFRDTTYDMLTEPYLTFVGAETPRSGVEERIHFNWTMAAGMGLWYNSESELEYDYHNAHSKNSYHAYFVPAEDKFYSIDGTDLGESILGDEFDDELNDHCLVKATLDTIYPPPMSTAEWSEVDGSNTSIGGGWSIINGDDGDISVNRYFHWTGTEWEILDLPNVPDESDMIDWRMGSFRGYDNYALQRSEDYFTTWWGIGSFDFTGTGLEDRLGDISMEKSCPVTNDWHPECITWVKSYAYTGTYDGFVMLGGHRTDYVPAKVFVELERATVNVGDVVNVNAYIRDKNGARILDATNSITITSDVGTFSSDSTDAYQGLLKGELTITNSTADEYLVVAASVGLDTGYAYIQNEGADTCNSFSISAQVTETEENDSTGSIDITVSGGTSPYEYLWHNDSTTQDLTDLPIGTYALAVTDDVGCVEYGSWYITDDVDSCLALNITAVVTDCDYGQSNGAINTTVSGGTSPYTYLWNDSNTDADRTGLSAASYSVTVTDDIGCTDTGNWTVDEMAEGGFGLNGRYRDSPNGVIIINGQRKVLNLNQ
jgi:hypothetical protein